MNQGDCPFCTLPRERVWLESGSAIALLDAYPVSIGHALVIPRRHAASLFDLTAEEQHELWSHVRVVRNALAEAHRPGGFNIGTHDGKAAGQTVGHAHIHVIPRYPGDVADPRGGLRWVIPAKARYW